MNDLEERLRTLLTERAQAAPNGQRMLARVRQESTRRQRRNRMILASGTAATLALTALGASALSDRMTNTPTPTATHIPARVKVSFVAGTPIDITFPFQPSAPLPDYSSPVAELVAGQPTLLYMANNGQTSITVSTATAPPPSSKPITILGTVGAIADVRGPDGQRDRILWWPAPKRQPVEITAPISAQPASFAKYLTTLAWRPTTPPAPFAFDFVPAGFTIDNITTDSQITFCPPGVPLSSTTTGKITVTFAKGSLTGGRPVTVAGGQGRISTAGGATVLQVDKGQFLTMTIQIPPQMHVAEQDLLQFANGIHLR